LVARTSRWSCGGPIRPSLIARNCISNGLARRRNQQQMSPRLSPPGRRPAHSRIRRRRKTRRTFAHFFNLEAMPRQKSAARRTRHALLPSSQLPAVSTSAARLRHRRRALTCFLAGPSTRRNRLYGVGCSANDKNRPLRAGLCQHLARIARPRCRFHREISRATRNYALDPRSAK
jgi:hypothetical protein